MTDVAILGAGPHGLAVAARFSDAGIGHRVFGHPMSFWHHMPRGMLLRSNWSATCIGDHRGPLTLDAYQEATGRRFGRPVPLQRFLEYGEWVQRRVAPDLDRRFVVSVRRDGRGFELDTEDGERVRARRVVVAAGIAAFAYRPPVFAPLPPDLVSHTGEHRDLDTWRGGKVLVVGGGQSALETAALLHEAGTEVEVLVRRPHLVWLRGGRYHRLLGPASRLVYAPTDVGPMGVSRMVAVPDLFRRLPRPVQERLARRSIRPAGARWLLDRLRDVPIRLDWTVARAERCPDGIRLTSRTGESRVADHVICGTGYRVDVGRYPFLSPELLAGVDRVAGYPVLRRGLESSVPGLFFVGAPAAWSFGPIMRFVSGGWYASRAVTRAVSGGRTCGGRSGGAAPDAAMPDAAMPDVTTPGRPPVSGEVE